MLDKLFNEAFIDIIFNNLNEAIKEFEEKNEINDDSNSYCHYVSDKYEDGKHVSHKEKIVKDGEVVKDENRCIDCKAKKEEIGENKCEAKKNVVTNEDKGTELDAIKKEKQELENKVKALTAENKALRDEMRDLSVKNYTLEKKVEQIKNIFK